jgi:hypothetical protein
MFDYLITLRRILQGPGGDGTTHGFARPNAATLAQRSFVVVIRAISVVGYLEAYTLDGVIGGYTPASHNFSLLSIVGHFQDSDGVTRLLHMSDQVAR